MEGMQCFASKIRKFCIQIGWKTLTNMKLSSFELLSIFDLVSCFFHTMYGFVFKGLILLHVPIFGNKIYWTKFLDLGSNAKLMHFHI